MAEQQNGNADNSNPTPNNSFDTSGNDSGLPSLQDYDFGDALAELQALFGDDTGANATEPGLEDLDIEALLKEAEELNLSSLLEPAPMLSQPELGAKLAPTSPPPPAAAKETAKAAPPPATPESVKPQAVEPAVAKVPEVVKPQTLEPAIAASPEEKELRSPLAIVGLQKDAKQKADEDKTSPQFDAAFSELTQLLEKQAEQETLVQNALNQPIETKSSGALISDLQSELNLDQQTMDPAALQLFAELEKDLMAPTEAPQQSTQALPAAINDIAAMGIEFDTDEDPAQVTAQMHSHEVQKSMEQMIHAQTTETPQAAPEVKAEVSAPTVGHHASLYDNTGEGDAYQYQDESEAEAAYLAELQRRSKIRRLLLASFLLVITAASLLGTYLHFKQKYLQQELVASRGMADLAMTLLHTKYHGKVPEGLSSSEASDFVQTNLKTLLPYPYQILSPLNMPTGINFPGYDVSIYTSDQLSRFLIVAKPSNSFLAFVTSSATLLAPSDTMQLYKTQKIKDWRVSFQNQTAHLDLTTEQLQELLATTAVPMSLASLNQGAIEFGFEAPQELLEKNPAAANLIYNAPKFYQFNAQIIEKATSIGTGEYYQSDIEELQQQIAAVSNLKDIVLYSPHGIPGILTVHRGMYKYTTGNHFLYGYLNFNQSSGRITQAKLLESQLTEENALTATNDKGPQGSSSSSAPLASKQLTFQQQVKSLFEAKEDTLGSIYQQIKDLLESNNQSFVPDFSTRYQKLGALHQKMNMEYNEKISQLLEQTLKHYQTLEETPAEISEVIKRLQLEQFLPQRMQIRATMGAQKAIRSDLEQPASKQAMNELLMKLQQANDFSEVYKIVCTATTLLHSIEMDDLFEKIELEKTFKDKVLRKVGSFITNPQPLETNQLFQQYQRSVLDKILRTAGIDVQQERDFYLDEFDRLANRLRLLPSQEALGHFQKVEEGLSHAIDYDPNLSPSQKQQAQEHSKVTQQEIENQKDLRHQIETQLRQIPIDTFPNLTTEEQTAYNIRKAEQIILGQDQKQLPEEQDRQLEQAIESLYPCVKENRALWKEILEARYYLLQTSENEIQNLLLSSLGLTSHQANALLAIKTHFAEYIASKHELSMVPTNSEQYLMQYKVFQQQNRVKLNAILEGCRTIQQLVQQFEKAVDNYINKLEALRSDYETSIRQGYNTNNPSHNYLIFSRVKYKIKLTQQLQTKLLASLKIVLSTCQSYQELAAEEMHALEGNGTTITPGNIATLQQRMNSISLPNLGAEQFPKQFSNLFGINVFPSAE